MGLEKKRDLAPCLVDVAVWFKQLVCIGHFATSALKLENVVRSERELNIIRTDEMGYELAGFVNEVDKEFICSICMMVMKNPVQSPCEHIFCSECIRSWIPLLENCPVDRQLLRPDDLKPTPRYFRNLLDKLEIRCKFESLGCEMIVPLERLQDHLANCKHKPDAIVDCDKGCNLAVTRREYQKNCLIHLANKFSMQMDEMTKLNEKLQHDHENFKALIRQQQEEIRKLTGDVNRQTEIMKKIINKWNAPPKLQWKISHNMKISADKPNVIEPTDPVQGFSWGFAQLSTSLGASHPFFRIQVVSVATDEYIVIGLTRLGHEYDELPGGKVGTIGYYNRGDLVVNGKVETGLRKWKNNDIIECGLLFPANSANGFSTNVEIYFVVNNQIVIKKTMKLPLEGLFPSIRMGSFTNSVPKIEYLYN
ncbi:E3 ubiquitin-protein ligase NRDP1 [Pseudolycoriella hygida]|uniref:E3 ubiquitin-protein ligase NRDP1 n=1 Tax=Pseudolycoriella hygida TaxID=35572 RepID=A0A9Q0MXV8_9DIPT|nr:E3 ubiquitin-protein ligase NRDP1 [Pseudolycoriella hygida]